MKTVNASQTIKDVCEHRQPTEHPRTKHLEGQEGKFRIRVGELRAVCELDKPLLKIYIINYRNGVYDSIDETLELRA